MREISIQEGNISDFETQFRCKDFCKPYIVTFGKKYFGRWSKCLRHDSFTEDEKKALNSEGITNLTNS